MLGALLTSWCLLDFLRCFLLCLQLSFYIELGALQAHDCQTSSVLCQYSTRAHCTLIVHCLSYSDLYHSPQFCSHSEWAARLLARQGATNEHARGRDSSHVHVQARWVGRGLALDMCMCAMLIGFCNWYIVPVCVCILNVSFATLSAVPLQCICAYTWYMLSV